MPWLHDRAVTKNSSTKPGRFPGQPDSCGTLTSKGLAVVIATSAASSELETLLDKLGANEVIDATTTKDDIDEPKPAPEVFEKAMRSGSIDPKRALAIGDSVWDVEGGAGSWSGVHCSRVRRL